MLSLGRLGGCSESSTPRENSRPTPLKHPPYVLRCYKPREIERPEFVARHASPLRSRPTDWPAAEGKSHRGGDSGERGHRGGSLCPVRAARGLYLLRRCSTL